jgi:hypothetical protein
MKRTDKVQLLREFSFKGNKEKSRNKKRGDKKMEEEMKRERKKYYVARVRDKRCKSSSELFSPMEMQLILGPSIYEELIEQTKRDIEEMKRNRV